jgi:ApbE superfamily uncharacterized protein (UPF0280 family)
MERVYRNRAYRRDLATFQVRVKETDLLIRADREDREEACRSVLRWRAVVEEYIRLRPEFLTALEPIGEDPLAPVLIREMLQASVAAGVGPMAAVAGAIAEAVGRDLLRHSRSVIVENGGDIFLRIDEGETSVGIFAGPGSPLNEKVALKIRAGETPLGVCTSSGTIGHSLSFGKADAVCVTAPSAALADAAATAVCNRIVRKEDIPGALERGGDIPGVAGIVVIFGDRLGAWGDVELAGCSG